MRNIFRECFSLSSLPDISKWNTNNIITADRIFSGCSSLSSLPNISKWNMNNVSVFDEIFYGCTSLSSLPDISNWNINKNNQKYKFMRNMFGGCPVLINKYKLS